MADKTTLLIDTGFWQKLRFANPNDSLEALNALAEQYDEIKYPPFMADEHSNFKADPSVYRDFQKWVDSHDNISTYRVENDDLTKFAGRAIPQQPGYDRADWEMKYEATHGSLKGTPNLTVASSDVKVVNWFQNTANVPTHRGIYDYLNTQVTEGKIDYKTYDSYHDNIKANIKPDEFSNKLPTQKLSENVVETIKNLDLTEEMKQVLSDPKVQGFSVDPDMKTQHYYSKANDAIVSIDNGTASISQGTEDYKTGRMFNDKMQDAAKRFPDFHEGKMPVRVQGGINQLADAVTDANKTGVLKTLGNAAEESGNFLGKASKILGPVGVGAATYEAYTLEAKAREFQDYGVLSDKAVEQYDLILAGHVGQAVADPTLVGGEAVTKAAYETWADHYELTDELKKELAPGLLIDAVGKAGQAIYDQYKNVDGFSKELMKDVNDGLKDLTGAPDNISSPKEEPAPDFKLRNFFGMPPSININMGDEASLEPRLQDISLEDAIGQLAMDTRTLNARADIDGPFPAQQAINHPDAAEMFKNLQDNNVTTLTAELSPQMDAEERVQNLLIAGRDATQEAGIPMPSEQREQAALQSYHYNRDETAEDDNSYGIV